MPVDPGTNEITMEFNNKTYAATWWENDGTITVDCAFGRLSSKAGREGEEFRARELLGEILKDARKRGDL